MSKPYDAATKFLIDFDPVAWLRLAGLSPESLPSSSDVEPVELTVEQVDGDLSTVSAAADRLLRVNLPTPRLYHLELQSSADPRLDERVHWYHTLARYEHRLPVRSIVFLLRPQAESSTTQGGFAEEDGAHLLQFRYQLVRLWELDSQTLLRGGLATLPLAPVVAKTRDEAAQVIEQMKVRLRAETSPADESSLWTAAYVLMGLTFPQRQVDLLMKGIRQVRESVTYQAIIAEGRAEGRAEGIVQGRENGRKEGLVESILLAGSKRFGPANELVQAQVELMSLDTLRATVNRLHEAESWDELLP